MFVNPIIALSNWILLLLFLVFQDVVAGCSMMQLMQFNISAADKCVWLDSPKGRHNAAEHGPLLGQLLR